jgi:hypothetical protein
MVVITKIIYAILEFILDRIYISTDQALVDGMTPSSVEPFLLQIILVLRSMRPNFGISHHSPDWYSDLVGQRTSMRAVI